MPITGIKKDIQEDGQTKPAFEVTFTNGAYQQLEDFRQYFKQTDLTEVIKLGMSFLQHIKEVKEKEGNSGIKM